MRILVISCIEKSNGGANRLEEKGEQKSRLHAGCYSKLLSGAAGRHAVRRSQQTTWRRERRRHAGVTFPARVINGSEPTKWRSFTELRCEREEEKGEDREGVYACGQLDRRAR